MEQGRWPGTWKVVCDVCGFWYPSDKIRKRWDNLMVCHKDWEQRHPQDFIRGVKDDPTPPFVRPDPPDDFLFFCDIAGSSGFADLGVADCAHADQENPHFDVLMSIVMASTIPPATPFT